MDDPTFPITDADSTSITATSIEPTATPTPASVVTTTLFPSSSDIPLSPPSRNGARPALIGSIVGGAVAGVAIAILAVILWTWWGRILDRKNEKHRREACETLTTKTNTRRNAALFSTPRSFDLLPSFHPRSLTTKVKFAPVPQTEHYDDNEETSLNRPPRLTSPPHELSHPTPRIQTTTPSAPPPVASRFMTQFPSTSPPPTIPSQHTIVNKPSNVSSISLYSTESAEEHRERLARSSINFAHNLHRNPSMTSNSPAADDGHLRTSWYDPFERQAQK